MDQTAADTGGTMAGRARHRAASAVVLVGVLCSLALAAVVQRTVTRLDRATLVNQAELGVERVQARLRDLEGALTATAAFLKSADQINVTDDESVPETTGLRPFVSRIVLPLDGVKWVGVLGHDRVFAGIPSMPADGSDPQALADLLDAWTDSPTAALDGDRQFVLGMRAADGLLLLVADLAGVFSVDGPNPARAIRPAWGSVRVVPDVLDASPEHRFEGGTILSRPVGLGDAHWRLAFQIAPGSLPSGLRWETLAILCFGLALTMLAAVHAHNVQRRSRENARLAARLEVYNAELRRRMAEAERFTAAMRESEHRFRDIYENALEGIFTTSPRGTFLSANPAMVRMLGYGTEEDLIREVQDTSRQLYVDPERRADFVRSVAERGTVQDFEAEIRRKDGGTLWLMFTARAVRDAGGGIVAYQGTAQDVTARRMAEEGLRQAKEQADMANRAKTEFLANMSHELRTPLNAIIGFSEIIGDQSMGPIGSDAYVEYARDIHESGKMLLDLINDILDLSKIEAGRKEINERAVDVPRLVRSSLRLVRERALKGQVELLTDLPDGLPAVWADEVACKQILSNLLSNAVKFTPPGGSVTAGATMAEDGRLVLFITDTGIGMKAEDIPKALEPFRQIEGSLARSSGGVGLGLPLVQALVALHGGEFGLESAQGQGTTVRVWLPADRLRVAPGLIPDRAKAGR